MKKIAVMGWIAVCAAAFAADPNPFANYTAGTASVKEDPSAADWHGTSAAAIAAETDDAKLAEIAGCPVRAKALLAEVKPAYATDPLTATKIAAVSQYVMRAGETSWWEFWAWFSDSPREIWTAALLDAAKTSDNSYRTEFMLDQLRWCGFPEQAEDVRAIGRAAKCKAVRDFACVVAKELDPAPKCPKDCALRCKAGWPYGSWGMKLPFDTMNAGHLILSEGKAELLWRWGSPFEITGKDLKIEKGGFTLTFGNHKPKDLPQDKSAWRLDRVTAKVVGDWAV